MCREEIDRVAYKVAARVLRNWGSRAAMAKRESGGSSKKAGYGRIMGTLTGAPGVW